MTRMTFFRPATLTRLVSCSATNAAAPTACLPYVRTVVGKSLSSQFVIAYGGYKSRARAFTRTPAFNHPAFSNSPTAAMSSNIVLLSLTRWTESHVSAILNATTEAAFNEAFDAFLSQDVHITVNGKHVTREQYKKQLASEKWTERPSDPASVKFEGAVEVPADKDHSVSAGTVGLFYTATIYGRFYILGAPSASTVNSSLNVVIEQDKLLPVPVYPPGVRGDYDNRRVSVLNEVVTDQADPIVLPKPLTENSGSA